MKHEIRDYLGLNVVIRNKDGYFIAKRRLREDHRGYYVIMQRTRIPVTLCDAGYLVGEIERMGKVPYEEGIYDGRNPTHRN